MAAIPLENPIVIPSQPERVYDEIWVKSLTADGIDPNKPVRVVAVLVPTRSLEDGSKEIYEEGAICLDVPDFFGTAEIEDLQVMGGLIYRLKIKAGV